MRERVGVRRFGSAVIRRWWLIVVLAIAGVVFGTLTSRLLPQSYTATTSVLVGAPLEGTGVHQDELGASEVLARTYADVILQEPILEGAVERLQLGTTWQALGTRVRAEVARDNQRMITIVVQAASPDEGIEIADEIPRQLALLVGDPDAGPEPTEDPGVDEFLGERRRSIRGHIDRARRSLHALRRETAEPSPDALGGSRSRGTELQRLIIDWYGDYLAVSRSMEDAVPIDHLEVFEPPSVVPASTGPQTWPHIAQSVLIALLLGLSIIYVVDLR